MLTPQSMQHATLYLLTEDIPAVGLALSEHECFNPEIETVDIEDLPDRPAEAYRTLYQQARTRLGKIFAHFEIARTPPSLEQWEPTRMDALARLDKQLGSLWHACSRWQEIVRRVDHRRRRTHHLQKLLDTYQTLDIDLSLLQKELRFLDVHVGAVPRDEVPRLRQAVKIAGYSLQVFFFANQSAYVALAGLKEAPGDLESVLKAASFHPLELPPEFHDRPHELRKQLNARARRIEGDIRRLQHHRVRARDHYRSFLQEADHAIARAGPCSVLSQGARNRGALTRVSGWVPENRSEGLRRHLHTRLHDRCLLELRRPRPEEFRSVPSLMRYPRLLRPFSMLVRNFGVPRYGELDPTLLFAVTFVVMFGMMFGDVGQGLILALAGVGLASTKRLRDYGPFFVAGGLASTFFGTLYGSVFGHDAWIAPLWVAPLEDPIRLLKVAIMWGIGLILVTTALTIRNRWVEGMWGDALFGGEGVAGALVYAAGILAVYRWLSEGHADLWSWLSILTPLVVMMGYQWHQSSGSVGERLLVVPILSLETLISYGTNTLSFLRVAAFGLNHAALALAVFTMADMTGPTGHWIILVLGNVFILVLEGTIVGIQVLRLEYYETFSRFYAGDGRPFQPLRVGVGKG